MADCDAAEVIRGLEGCTASWLRAAFDIGVSDADLLGAAAALGQVGASALTLALGGGRPGSGFRGRRDDTAKNSAINYGLRLSGIEAITQATFRRVQPASESLKV